MPYMSECDDSSRRRGALDSAAAAVVVVVDGPNPADHPRPSPTGETGAPQLPNGDGVTAAAAAVSSAPATTAGPPLLPPPLSSSSAPLPHSPREWSGHDSRETTTVVATTVTSSPPRAPSSYSSVSPSATDDDGSKRGELSNGGNGGNRNANTAVAALFGPAVGTCVGAFPASYYHVSGKLFAATDAILFHSNLFGFERRLCLRLGDVDGVESYRSTSVRIFMVDCEEYVFKKLAPDRDHVLDLLMTLLLRHRARCGGGGGGDSRSSRRQAAGLRLGADVVRASGEGPQPYQFPNDGKNGDGNGLMQTSGATSTTKTATTTIMSSWGTEGGGRSEKRLTGGDLRMMDPGRRQQSVDGDDDIYDDDEAGHDLFAMRDDSFRRPRLSSDHTPEPSRRRRRNDPTAVDENGDDDDGDDGEGPPRMPPASCVTPNQHHRHHSPIRRRSNTEPTFRTHLQRGLPSLWRGESFGSISISSIDNKPTAAARGVPPPTGDISRAVSESGLLPPPHSCVTKEGYINGARANGPSSSYAAAGGLTLDDSNLDLSGEVRTRLFAEEIKEEQMAVEAATSAAVPPPPPSTPPPPPPPTLLQTQTSSANKVHPEALHRAWRDAKKPHDHVAVEAAVLNHCSLETFYELFFADDAPHALARYQREKIGDKDVEFGLWKDTTTATAPEDVASTTPLAAASSSERRISYLHPLNSSLGPSEAKTTRLQRLLRFGEHGIILENTTVVEGIPMADCFKVVDHWIVESDGEASNGTARRDCGPSPSLTLSVTFQVVFTKRTMFKSLIQKNVKSETKKWFEGYVAMLQQALMEHHRHRLRNEEEAAAHKNVQLVTIAARDEWESQEIGQKPGSGDSGDTVVSDPSPVRNSSLVEVVKATATRFLAAERAAAVSLETLAAFAVCGLFVILIVHVAAMRQSLANMEVQLQAMQSHSAALLEVIQELTKVTAPERMIRKDCMEQVSRHVE